MQNSLNDSANLLGRLLLAAIFFWSGYGKLVGYAATVGYMEKFGMPAALLPLAILLEIGGGVLLVIGWRTRTVAIGLAAFTLLTAIIFHSNFGDRNQLTHFMKNLAIAGGFLAVGVAGAGRWSVDARRSS